MGWVAQMRGLLFLVSAAALVEFGIAAPAMADGRIPYAKKAQVGGGVTLVTQRDGGQNQLVLCRMPSRVRKLGPSRVALSPPRLARVNAAQCAARGGRVVRR